MSACRSVKYRIINDRWVWHVTNYTINNQVWRPGKGMRRVVPGHRHWDTTRSIVVIRLKNVQAEKAIEI